MEVGVYHGILSCHHFQQRLMMLLSLVADGATPGTCFPKYNASKMLLYQSLCLYGRRAPLIDTFRAWATHQSCHRNTEKSTKWILDILCSTNQNTVSGQILTNKRAPLCPVAAGVNDQSFNISEFHPDSWVGDPCIVCHSDRKATDNN